MNNYKLVDQYTGDVFDILQNYNQSDPIEIQPGDGMLLKLCLLPVPQEITSSNSCTIGGVSSDDYVYIPYDVTVQNGGSLIINGNVEFGSHSTLTVEDGGIVILWGENKFGKNSEIIVEGDLYINPDNPVETVLSSKFDSWLGIKCLNGGYVSVLNDAIIENAETGLYCDESTAYIKDSAIRNCYTGIHIKNASTLDLISSIIEVRNEEYATGIAISNAIAENNVTICGSENHPISIIGSENNGIGLWFDYRLEDENSSLVCDFVEFSNLSKGVHFISSVKTATEINNCDFYNCDVGIYLIGNGSMRHISNCDLAINTNKIGIYQNTISCKISECTFTNLDDNCAGIELDNSFCDDEGDSTPEDRPSSIDGCIFNDNVVGINCVNANPRITNCEFYENGPLGLKICNNSVIDMSWSANNKLCIYPLKILFHPSGILQLQSGHNDFMDTGLDFAFPDTYEYQGNTINCNGNYWEDWNPTNPYQDPRDYIDIQETNMPEGFIIADHQRMDDDPNTTTYIEPKDRFEEAGMLESSGEPDAAFSLYATILTDLLEVEMCFWKISIDRVFSLSIRLDNDLDDLLLFYDNFLINIPEFVPLLKKEELITFVKNYQKKIQIEIKNYQEAADIVVERIDNPSSPVDSLFAVMELESIYYIASLENGRANVSTLYQQHNPENDIQLQQWHDDHWKQINKLLGIGDEHENVTIPIKPELYNNFPNPFNPETTISFSIPEDSKVNLSIYNIKGQKVRTLTNDELVKGNHDVVWKSKDNSGKSVSSGIYFYKFDVNGKTKGLKKMLLLK